MAETKLPFKYKEGSSGCKHGRDCSILGYLPKPLRIVCEQNNFLAEYLHHLPMYEIGVPAYYVKLSRKLSGINVTNLIYPIEGGLFVHVFPDPSGARDFYITIEPTTVVNVDHIMEEIEPLLLDYAEEIGNAETEDDKKSVLLRVIDEICVVVEHLPDTGSRNGTAKNSTRNNGKKNGKDEEKNGKFPAKIPVTPLQLEGIKYRVLRDKAGMGVLEPLLLDPYIEDISCSGLGPIFIEHKIFRSVQSTITFSSMDDLDQFVVWLGEWIKKPVTVRDPIVDAVLPDGSRINIVYGREIAKRGSNFTIRKFSDTPLSIMELIEFGTLDYMMASYISFLLEEGMNVFVSGATASGKTTLLNAINTFILPGAKIVTIEDTPEVQVPHVNWVREVTRGSSNDKEGEVGMFQLLKAALRQRPDRIIIGEIRGEEGLIAFQAMQTGHGVMSTFHAASVEKLIQRLTGSPINVPKSYVDNLNVVVIQAAVRLPNGRQVRRVLSINEILGYDPVEEAFSFVEVFRWNPSKDKFDFPGYMNSFLLEETIAMKRGLPPHKRKAIYTDLKRRAKIFERLHKDKGVRGFNEFFTVLAEAQRQKLL